MNATLIIPSIIETMTTGCLAAATATDCAGGKWRAAFSLDRGWEVTCDGRKAGSFTLSSGCDFRKSAREVVVAYLRSAGFTGFAEA